MLGKVAKAIFGSANDRRLKTYRPKVQAINALEPEIAKLSDEALAHRTVEFREQGARTEVVLVHDNFVGPGPVEMYDEGWRSGLNKLRALLRPQEETDANRE